MGRRFLDPGLLRQRATLQAPTLVPDGAGGAAEGWTDVAAVSIRIEPLTVRLAERFDQREARATHRVICRHRGDVDRGMAFAVGARRLAIRSVHDPDETGRYLICRCEEER